MSRRIQRVNNLIRHELGHILQHQLKDPRVSYLVSITEVVTSTDLRHAKVFVSILSSEEEKKATLKALTSATGFIRKELANQLSLRRVPELSFYYDDSIERGAHLSEIFDRLAKT